jgi:spermidine/putrescine transport system permease protein
MKERAGNRTWLASILPGAGWEILFVLLPFIGIVVISFLTRGEFGDIERPFTFANYKQLAGFGIFGFEPLYPLILLRSCVLAVVTTVVCAAAALPVAFFIASLSPARRTLAITLVTIPVWTNLLVRTYAWQLLLSPSGMLSQTAVTLGWIKRGEALYPSIIAVVICLVCDYLPLAILPLYASVEKLDPALIEAAKDLGASRFKVFRHAVYPQIKPGLWAGVIFVLLPAIGQFVIPDLLGGAKTSLLGNALQQQFGQSRNWPFGAALAVVSMAMIFGGVALYLRQGGKDADLV